MFSMICLNNRSSIPMSGQFPHFETKQGTVKSIQLTNLRQHLSYNFSSIFYLIRVQNIRKIIRWTFGFFDFLNRFAKFSSCELININLGCGEDVAFMLIQSDLNVSGVHD